MATHAYVLAAAVLTVSGGTLAVASCGESEAAREEQAMAAAIPQRLQADGSIRLSDEDKEALGLRTEAAATGSLASMSLRYGVVHAPLGQDALVVSPVAGKVARAPAAQLGAVVKEGAALVEIVPSLGTAERVSLGVQSADIAGQIESLTHEFETKGREVQRNRELAKSNVVSEQALQQSDTALAALSAKLEALRQAQKLRASADGVTLRAPVDGTLVQLDAQVGAAVQAGQILARVLTGGGRWIDVAVQPTEPPGTAYEVDIAAGQETPRARVAARLLARGFVVGEDGARRDRIVVEGEGAARLLPGAVVSVYVAGDEKRGILVPETAVVTSAGGDVVFVEIKPSVFAARPVDIGARLGGTVRVDGGVAEGERVVMAGAIALFGESKRAELRHTE